MVLSHVTMTLNSPRIRGDDPLTSTVGMESSTILPVFAGMIPR